MDFANLLNITWSPTSIILIFVFFAIMFVGFLIIYKEIKIVIKKEIGKEKYLFSFIFGFIFASSVMLGVLVAVQYISAAASTLATLIPVQTVYFPRFTTILFLISSIILICFPLIELLYLATKKKQNSEFFYQNAINDGVLSKIGDNKLKIGRASCRERVCHRV